VVVETAQAQHEQAAQLLLQVKDLLVAQEKVITAAVAAVVLHRLVKKVELMAVSLVETAEMV
jgi:hypothetical protein